MKPLPKQYDHKEAEKRWQQHWLAAETYGWDASAPREQTFVIDTPPPTVSGLLHMGHIFSYTQADFVARYQRMAGKSVFYPMGFDDNGLPTERLVEKVKKVRATEMSREDFTALCESVAEEARAEFRELFRSVALSVDWNQEYHTISDEARKLSQMSFLDLLQKGHAYRELKPFFWDPVDQTAIAQAEIEDKELASQFVDIRFTVIDAEAGAKPSPASGRGLGESSEPFEAFASALTPTLSQRERGFIVIGTTRPELIPACVGVFYHPDDERYQHLKGKFAVTPLFGVRVPILEDETVEPDKGTGIMMCCTFGDEKDIEKWRKHRLETRVILNQYGKLDAALLRAALASSSAAAIASLSSTPPASSSIAAAASSSSTLLASSSIAAAPASALPTSVSPSPTRHPAVKPQDDGWGMDMDPPVEPQDDGEVGRLANIVARLANKKTSNPDPKNPGAREIILEMLRDSGDLVGSKPILHAVKCAERSGAPLEILPTQQWFVRIMDKKEALKAKAAECDWKPAFMKIRIDQWIDGLNSDWCISRQRYFGVPFPVWYVRKGSIEKKSASGQSQNDGAASWNDGTRSRNDGTPLRNDGTPLRNDRGPLEDGAGFAHDPSPAHPSPAHPSPAHPDPVYSGPVYSDPAEIYPGPVETVVALPDQLPLNPLASFPTHRFPGSEYSIEAIKPIPNPSGNKGNSLNEYSANSGVWKVVNRSDETDFYLVEAEKDVMDTWATSSVSPQLSSKGITPEFCLDAERHAKLFPADLRPQAHEIIRSWAFYTIVKAHLHEDTIPWHHLMISGWCLAADKSKMSKSKGNVVTPVALIEEKGADAVRYWAGTSRLGADTAFSEDLLKIGRKLVTKLWNATQFAGLHLDKLVEPPTTPKGDMENGRITETLDRWILTRLARTIEAATAAFERFEYADARAATEDFFWNDFCDNYLELVKTRAYGNPDEAATHSALYTLHHCLNAVLKLFAPFVPHIAEELYSHVFEAEYAAAKSLHARGMWPKASDYAADTVSEAIGREAVSLLNAIRKAKSERNLSIKFPVKEMVIAPGGNHRVAAESLQAVLTDLQAAGSVERVRFETNLPEAPHRTEDHAWLLDFTFAEAGEAA